MKGKEPGNYVNRFETCVPKIMRGLRIMRKGPAEDGLNLSQELVLISLLQNGKSKMSDLSESTWINATALTTIVDGLFYRDVQDCNAPKICWRQQNLHFHHGNAPK